MDRPKSVAGVTVITLFLIAQIPFSLAEWMAIGRSPDKTGLYNVIIQAVYRGMSGTFPLELSISDRVYSLGGLTVEPVYPIPRTPPITLKYDIKLNGSRDFAMLESKVSVYYLAGNTLIGLGNITLEEERDGLWSAEVDVPFKGDYKAVVSIVVEKRGERYGGEFITQFSSDAPSPDLEMEANLEKKILTPSESFDVTLKATFDGSALPAANVFKANLYGTVKDLLWDGGDGLYRTDLTAPRNEGIYPLSVYAEGQTYISQNKIYVVDISRPKSARCPLVSGGAQGCSDMKDVRKCVADYKAKNILIPEQELVNCYEAVSPIAIGELICERGSKGDFDGDGHIEIDDLAILQNSILPLGQISRQDYKDCGDYDRDGDVDEKDLECLSKVVSGKWFGDLHGGICFDMKLDTPLKCDLDGDNFIKEGDVAILDKLLAASSDGVEMADKILKTCDFDMDGSLTQGDKGCLSFFLGMEMDNPKTLLAYGQTIPRSCMSIYTMNECKDIQGDINGDLVINRIDEILILLIVNRQVTGYSMKCADVNKDSRITEEDYICIRSYTAGNRDYYFNICLDCDESMPKEYRFRAEICNDNYDNDCDGFIDRTSTGLDYCDCVSDTPCWFVKDNDGGTVGGINDLNVRVCRKTSWDGSGSTPGFNTSGGYKWYLPSELVCNKEHECETMTCASSEYKCAFSGKEWKWYELGVDKLPKETDDPMDKPKTCDDTFDNDCDGGDKKCKKVSMFESWEFWVSALTGAALGWFLGPAVAGILAVVLTGVQMAAGVEGPLAKAMMGFSIGLAVGGIGGSLAGSTGEALKAGSLGRAITGKVGSLLGTTPEGGVAGAGGATEGGGGWGSLLQKEMPMGAPK